MRRHVAFQPRPRPAPVARPDGARKSLPADVGAAAPVAADLPERVQADGPTVGCHTRGVDALTADEDHAPPAIRAGPQGAKSVVADDVLSRRSRAHPRRRAAAGCPAGCRRRQPSRHRSLGAPATRMRRPPRRRFAARDSIPGPSPTAWCELVGRGPPTAAGRPRRPARRPSSSSRHRRRGPSSRQRVQPYELPPRHRATRSRSGASPSPVAVVHGCSSTIAPSPRATVAATICRAMPRPRWLGRQSAPSTSQLTSR